MATRRFVVSVTDIAVVGGADPATILAVRAGNDDVDAGVQLVAWSISFDGVDATHLPVLVELIHANNGGTFGAITPALVDDDDFATIETEGRGPYSAEPAAIVLLLPHRVSPALGVPYTDKDASKEGLAAAGKNVVLGIRCTAADDVNATAYLIYEA